MRRNPTVFVLLGLLAVLVTGSCRRAPLAPITQNTNEMVGYIENPNSIVKWYHLWGTRRNVTSWFPSDYQMGGVYRVEHDVWIGPFDGGGHAGQYQALAVTATQGDYGQMANEAPPPNATEYLRAGTRVRFQQMWIESDGRSDAVLMPYVEVQDGPLQGRWIGMNRVSITKRRSDQEIPHPCNVDPQVLATVPDTPPQMSAPGVPPMYGPPSMDNGPGVPGLPINVGLGPIGNGPVQLGVGPFGGR